MLPNGSCYLLRTGETNPTDMAAPSPDDRVHHCTYYPVANDNALFVVLASSLADQRTPRTKALVG
jgi:hypothetical protein